MAAMLMGAALVALGTLTDVPLQRDERKLAGALASRGGHSPDHRFDDHGGRGRGWDDGPGHPPHGSHDDGHRSRS